MSDARRSKVRGESHSSARANADVLRKILDNKIESPPDVNFRRFYATALKEGVISALSPKWQNGSKRFYCFATARARGGPPRDRHGTSQTRVYARARKQGPAGRLRNRGEEIRRSGRWSPANSRFRGAIRLSTASLSLACSDAISGIVALSAARCKKYLPRGVSG